MNKTQMWLNKCSKWILQREITFVLESHGTHPHLERDGKRQETLLSTINPQITLSECVYVLMKVCVCE